MSPLWSDDRVMTRYRDFIECNGAEYANIAWQSVVLEMRDDLQQRITELDEKLHWMDIQILLRDEKVEHLEAENARLRAILSDADVIGAIRTVSRNLADRDANDEWLPERDAIHVWLQNLESETWPSLGDMYPDTCQQCAGMGAALRWDANGNMYVCECECGKGDKMIFDLEQHIARQIEFSQKTFGPGQRTNGVIDHIRKELGEIEADPTDIEEWIDVLILAIDGAWRAGYTPGQIIEAVVAKQTKNEARLWPDWRTVRQDKAIEHKKKERE